jgi:putative transposase
MARMARIKVDGEAAAYHVYGRIASFKGDYALSKPLCRKTLIDTFKHYAGGYFCQVAALNVMGSHYHAVIKFEAYRTLTPEELLERALLLYPNSTFYLDDWTQDKWDRFQERLFDMSEFMRNVHSSFARFFNKTYERHGRFWADRFKSTLLEDDRALLDCMLYVELNAVRAGLVVRPDEWKGSSLYLREAGQGDWLMPLTALFDKTRKRTLAEYRSLVYYRGEVPTREGQWSISGRIVKEEAARGFEVSGVYRKRLRYFVDGLVIGSEGFVREHLNRLRDHGSYTHRKHPIVQLEGIHLSLREQRCTAVDF